MRFHVQTGGSTLTAQQPDTTSCAPPSRRWRRPRRHAVAPHQRARRGAGPADAGDGPAGAADAASAGITSPGSRATVDPLAGSYYVETLTEADRGEASHSWRDRRAGRDARGHRAGLPAARSPTPPTRSSGRSRRGADRGRGQRFADEGDEQRPQPQVIDPGPRPSRSSGRAVRARRDRGEPGRRALAGAAAGTENVVPRIAPRRGGCHLGEIATGAARRLG